MNNIEFRNCDENSRYFGALERLFQAQWADFLFADTYKAEVNLPPVLLALRDGEVIGGLAYSHYQEPHTCSEVVWINAVFVLPQWRSQGIASELINRGVKQVSANLQSNLYVYTNITLLYQYLGWSVVDIESEPNHSVMSIALKD